MALGILGGAAYAVLKPPMLASTALIVLPPQVSQQQNGATTTISGSDPFTATQVIVAGSNQVLVDALPDVNPPLSLPELRRRIQVASPAPEIIAITAKGTTAADAEATANAVTHSYVSLVNSPNSPVGSIRARLLESARTATGTAPIEWTVIWALVGGLGALIGVIVALAIGRNDRRLRERDEIANSVGIPVLASVPVAHPSAAAGWTSLLEDYKPASVHAWQLRAALQQLDVVRSAFGRPRTTVTAVPCTMTASPPSTTAMAAHPRSWYCPCPPIPVLSPWGRNWPPMPPRRTSRQHSSSALSRTRPPRPRFRPRAPHRQRRHRSAAACCG